MSVAATAALLLCCLGIAQGAEPRLSAERMVFETVHGAVEMGFYPDVAPRTVEHILELGRLGCYNTNHFFRVDKGFVAQTADVAGGRLHPLTARQKAEADKNVPLEVTPEVVHTRGVLSMARWDDPNSATSSFSILLGDAPHLDMTYTVFGRVLSGFEVMEKLQTLETRREGIFVMPKERITIASSYVYTPEDLIPDTCEDKFEALQRRFDSQSRQLQEIRKRCLPG